MLDLIDAASPLLGTARALAAAIVSHHLIPSVLFFLTCMSILVASSLQIGRARHGGRTRGGAGQPDGRRSTPFVLHAYPVPYLRYVDRDVNAGSVRVALTAALPDGSTHTDTHMDTYTDAGPSLHAHIVHGLINTLVIDGFVWMASRTTDPSENGLLELSNPSRDSSFAPFPTTTPAISAMQAWGSGLHPSLVLAFKDGTK